MVEVAIENVNREWQVDLSWFSLIYLDEAII